MREAAVVYQSAQDKTDVHADCYLQTHEASYRYLAYRDVPTFIRRFVKGKTALDYGTGTGASASFLSGLDFDAVGVDISPEMLEKARYNFPLIQFCKVDALQVSARFDLVFSSFVLLELSSKEAIVKYLKKAAHFLQEDGIFIAITGSEQLHSSFRRWSTFDANFEENHKLLSGKLVKLSLAFPKMEFYDYFWKKTDYLECFEKAGLDILHIHSPCGSLKDPYVWQDELFYSPFTIFIAKKLTRK